MFYSLNKVHIPLYQRCKPSANEQTENANENDKRLHLRLYL